MFVRAINVIFLFFFALPLFAGVTAAPRRPPGNSGHSGNGGNGGNGSNNGPRITTITTINNNCNVGSITCCNSVQQADSTNFGDLLGPLSSLIGPISGNVGLTCSGSGASCSAQTVCCQGNHFNGLIAVGCNPISVGA